MSSLFAGATTAEELRKRVVATAYLSLYIDWLRGGLLEFGQVVACRFDKHDRLKQEKAYEPKSDQHQYAKSGDPKIEYFELANKLFFDICSHDSSIS